jgi:hypothetical protein
MNTPLKIITIAGISFLLGAAVLFGFVSGPLGALFSPLLSVFGWFYFPVALLAASLMWVLYTPALASVARRTGFVAVGGLLGAITMHLIGVREQGGAFSWTLGYLIGGGLAGVVAAYLVTRWRTHAA